MKLSIVIPCYNEKNNLPLIFSRLKDVLGERKDIEILLVNNGSTDGSDIVFEKELSMVDKDIFKLVYVPINQGYGYGILEGLKASSGDILGWTHADMQTDPNDVLIAFNFFLSSVNKDLFVKGKRRNRKSVEKLFTFGMQCIASAALGMYLDDINAQPKLFSRDFYNEQVRNKAPFDFSLDLFVLYQAKRNRSTIELIPVYFRDRIHGEAKGGGGSNFSTRLKLVKRTFAYIFKLKRDLKNETV